jgi:hypothetical protein
LYGIGIVHHCGLRAERAKQRYAALAYMPV